MKVTFLFLPFVFCSITIISCEDTPTAPNNSYANLISNPSFEVNGHPSFQNWIVDSTLATIVSDILPTGPKSCVRLYPGWIPEEGFARTYVSGRFGSGIYKLNLWMKSGNSWRGTIKIGRWSQNTWSFTKQITNNSTDWTQVTLIDTITLEPTDSIAVHLSAGSTEVVSGYILCTKVSLEKIQQWSGLD